MKKMSLDRPRQRKVRLRGGGKQDVRTQFGAICWRRKGGEVQVLLITSRRRKRWIIPRGWPMDRATPAEAAATEAWEEAGVEGKVKPVCLGIYSYDKEVRDGEFTPCVVAVFPIRVKVLHAKFPERNERKRKWFSLEKAAKLVSEPELAAMLERFDPKRL